LHSIDGFNRVLLLLLLQCCLLSFYTHIFCVGKAQYGWVSGALNAGEWLQTTCCEGCIAMRDLFMLLIHIEMPMQL
jgi:hypothetical protein